MTTQALTWDEAANRIWETGAKKPVLYPKNTTTGTYSAGVAWNGLTSVTETPDGASKTALYANDIEYGSMYSPETFGGTIKAYTYPNEWEQCDGSLEIAKGVVAGQQTRVPFALCYRTQLENADVGEAYGYKLHLIYGATASPSEKEYDTVNDSPSAVEFSWEFTTSMVTVSNSLKPTGCITIDSTKVDATKLAALETILYGSETAAARLPLPPEIITLMSAA